MTVTYHYSNLQSLADRFENDARRLREAAATTTKKQFKLIHINRAAELENVVHVLRNTMLEEVKPQ